MQFWIPELLVSQLPVKLSKIELTENSMFLSETALILFYDGLYAKFQTTIIWGTAAKIVSVGVSYQTHKIKINAPGPNI